MSAINFSHGSLFTGIGGFDLAAEWMGGNNTFHCEKNDFRRALLKTKWPKSDSYGNIEKTDFTIYKGRVNILTGGFPCQDISNAKSWTTNDKYKVSGIEGARSGLWWHQLRAVDEIRPLYMVGENVAALTKKGLDVVVQSLSEIGYFSEWRVISSNRVGAPHRRERIWIVAYPHSIGRHQESVILSQILKKKTCKAPQWELSRTICSTTGKKTLPKSFGVYDGVPKGLHHAERIAALGDSINPYIALEIFKQIEVYQSSINN